MFIWQKGKPNYQAATHNIVFDGNSLVAGAGASTQYLANKVHSFPILSSSGLSVKSFGIGSQTFANMSSNHSDIDSSFVSGRRNILICWEGTNSIYFGRTGDQAASDGADYVNSVKSLNPSWEVYVLTTIPRRQIRNNGDSIEIFNFILEDYDSQIRSNWRSLGFNGFIDLREKGSPFRFTGYSTSDFANIDAYLASGEKSTNAFSVHLNASGYDLVAKFIEQKLRSIGA